jgi:hypothetical protein
VQQEQRRPIAARLFNPEFRIANVHVRHAREYSSRTLAAASWHASEDSFLLRVSDAAGLVRVREVILPDRTNEAAYRDWFSMYRDTYKALRPMFARRAAYKTLHFLDGVDRLENL